MTKIRTTTYGRNRALIPSDGASVVQTEETHRGAASPAAEYSAEQIKALRLRLGVSQTTFAHHMGTTKGVVTQWEQGLRNPSRATHKLLWVVDRHGLKVLT